MRRRRDALLDFRVTASCVVIAAVRRAKRLAGLALSPARPMPSVSEERADRCAAFPVPPQKGLEMST